MAGQPVPAAARAYLQELDSYERGEYQAAAAILHNLNVYDVRQWITAALAEIDDRVAALERADVAPGEVARLRQAQIRIITRALLVHTDVVAQTTDEVSLHAQLWLCQRILADIRNVKLPPGDEADQQRSALRLLTRDWYLVVVSHMQYLNNLPYLRGHIAAGLAMFSDDADLLLARGSVFETEAHLAMVDRSLGDAIYTPEFVKTTRHSLTAAADDYKAVLRLQPSMEEARLRLGRVNRLLGDRIAARSLYDQVKTNSAVARLKVLARLFSGELAELENDAKAADADYRAAHALAPAAQAPMLAVSRLCDAGGDSACAKDWLRRSFAAASPERQDPWWGYLRGQAWLLRDRLAQLRARGLGR